VVETGIDRTGSKTVEKGAERKPGPDSGQSIVECAQADEGATEREENADVENLAKPPCKKTRKKIAATIACEDPGNVPLLEVKRIANGGPGHTDERIWKSQTDKSEVAYRQKSTSRIYLKCSIHFPPS
jgi:hypothetical protein